MEKTPPSGGSAAPSGDRPGFRYSTLAKVLTEEIQSGRYAVGEKIPTETELQNRFDASRHTVREALRSLKEEGLLSSRAGVGTVVRSIGQADGRRYMQSTTTLQELVQSAEATRLQLMSSRDIIADAGLSQRLGIRLGQQMIEASVRRFQPGSDEPTAWILMYLRPEHANVVASIDESSEPVHVKVERMHGVRIAEVRQQIIAIQLNEESARLLNAAQGSPCLRITRRFFDAQDRILFATVGCYPSDRFSHDTAFRVVRD